MIHIKTNKKKHLKQNKNPHQLYEGSIQRTLKEQSLKVDLVKIPLLSFLSWVRGQANLSESHL